MNKKKLGKMFKALGDENRLRILELIKEEEKCACKILDELHISQSTLSHHMKVLGDAGIINSRKDGKWTHYSIDNKGIDEVIEILNRLRI